MSKRKSGDARVDKSEKSKKLVEKAGVGFDEKPDRWPEFKRQGRLRAVKMGFDVERLLFFGDSLDERIADLTEQAIKDREEFSRLWGNASLLKVISDKLADELALLFTDGNDSGYTDDIIRLALSFLYLFPKFWKATEKPLTLDEMKALDIDDLLSERR